MDNATITLSFVEATRLSSLTEDHETDPKKGAATVKRLIELGFAELYGANNEFVVATTKGMRFVFDARRMERLAALTLDAGPARLVAAIVADGPQEHEPEGLTETAEGAHFSNVLDLVTRGLARVAGGKVELTKAGALWANIHYSVRIQDGE